MRQTIRDCWLDSVEICQGALLATVIFYRDGVAEGQLVQSAHRGIHVCRLQIQKQKLSNLLLLLIASLSQYATLHNSVDKFNLLLSKHSCNYFMSVKG